MTLTVVALSIVWIMSSILAVGMWFSTFCNEHRRSEALVWRRHAFGMRRSNPSTDFEQKLEYKMARMAALLLALLGPISLFLHMLLQEDEGWVWPRLTSWFYVYDTRH